MSPAALLPHDAIRECECATPACCPMLPHAVPCVASCKWSEVDAPPARCPAGTPMAYDGTHDDDMRQQTVTVAHEEADGIMAEAPKIKSFIV